MPESFPMNGGDGTYSYTKNSQYQREASNVAKGLIEEAIMEKLDVESLMTRSNSTFRIADLGCSVGPNTFFAMQNVIEAVENKHNCQRPVTKKLEFQVFLNDHIANDFNTLFKSLPPGRKYFAAGVPGSFYEQLFPKSSIHFMHSSYALHWLSKLPEETLNKDSSAWNKGRIHYTGATDEVEKCYAGQFGKDMEIFLNARAEEMVPGGMMVLIMPGLPDGVHHSQLPVGVLFNFLGSSLVSMVKEGIIDEAQVDSFNIPIYAASPKEITRLVERNGCFSIQRIEVTNPRSKIGDQLNVEALIMHLRAGMTETFSKHFGSKIAEEMFSRTCQKSEEIKRWMDSSYHGRTQLFVVLKRI